MEDNSDMRNMILSDLIDKMHGRMADKMFPPDPDLADQPAVTAVSPEAMAMDKAVDEDNDVEACPTDEELDELMR